MKPVQHKVQAAGAGKRSCRHPSRADWALDAFGHCELGELARGQDRAEIRGTFGGGPPRTVGPVALDRFPGLIDDHVRRVIAVDQDRGAQGAGERAGAGERRVDYRVRGFQ